MKSGKKTEHLLLNAGHTPEEIGNGDSTIEAQRAEYGFYSHYCKKIIRKQSCYFVTTYNDIYLLQFNQRQSNELKNKQRFKRVQPSI